MTIAHQIVDALLGRGLIERRQKQDALLVVADEIQRAASPERIATCVCCESSEVAKPDAEFCARCFALVSQAASSGGRVLRARCSSVFVGAPSCGAIYRLDVDRHRAEALVDTTDGVCPRCRPAALAAIDNMIGGKAA